MTTNIRGFFSETTPKMDILLIVMLSLTIFTAKVKVLFHCYCGGIVPARLLGLAHWHDLDPCAAGWCQCLLSVIVLTSIYLCTSGAGVLSSQFGLDIQVDLPDSG